MSGYHDSGYSMGEAEALLGPLAGADPDDILEWALVVVTDDHQGGAQVRVGSSAGNAAQTVRILATAIVELSGDMGEEQ